MTEWAPATEAEAAMRDALRADDQELYFRILARTELLLPISSEAIAGRVPMGWGTWTAGDRTHVLAFTSSEAMHACLAEHAGSARKIPYYELAAAWPNLEWWLAVNPGLPIEGYLPAWFVSQLARGDVRLPGRTSGRSVPADRVETLAPDQPERLAQALPGQPRQLPARSELPRRNPSRGREHAWGREQAWGTSQSPDQQPPPEQPWDQQPSPVQERPWGQQPARGREQRWGQEQLREARELREARDAIGRRGGTGRARVPSPPAGALDPAALAAGPDPAAPEPAPDPFAGFQPANDLEAQLVQAATTGAPGGFLSVLLLAKVLLPVAEDADPALRPGSPGFQWRTEKIDGAQCVAVFTSPERLDAHIGHSAEVIPVRFMQLIRAWPDESWSLVVNPATPIGATLLGAQVAGLASSAAEVGLDDDAGEAGEFAAGAAVAGAVAAEAPVAMQKTIAPSQVGWYLERGYDRVSGFVHRAQEVAHLKAPAVVIAALGLQYEGSPFDSAADEVYVLRWQAYCPHLYRIPYGGRTEAAMSAMQGWVIERAPFRGNGFAPADSGDVIAEFKVDSIRLPHGAELWRLRSNGDQQLVAVLDADGPSWQRRDGGV